MPENQPPMRVTPGSHRGRRYMDRLRKMLRRLDGKIEERAVAGRPSDIERAEREALQWAIAELEVPDLITGN